MFYYQENVSCFNDYLRLLLSYARICIERLIQYMYYFLLCVDSNRLFDALNILSDEYH